MTNPKIKYFAVICPECGWFGSSENCAGGDAIADTGDYSDIVCPDCYKNDLWNPVHEVS